MIVVTGASGFVGRHLVANLRAHGADVRPVLRRSAETPGAVTARLDHAEDWPQLLQGADAVVHLAAHNPPPGDRRGRADTAAFRRVNADGTALVAREAAKAGVARFVFMSSIRVYGAGSDAAFTEDSPLVAEDPYGRSKREAEAALKHELAGTATGWTILRPPAIYGPERAGVLSLLHRAIRAGLPVPLPQPEARRSLVYVGNVTAAVAACLAAEAAANETFNVCDGPGLSYREMAGLVGAAVNRRPRLVRLPAFATGLAGRVPVAGPLVRRLAAPSLCDDTRIRAALGWTPPFTSRQGIAATFAASPPGEAA